MRQRTLQEHNRNAVCSQQLFIVIKTPTVMGCERSMCRLNEASLNDILGSIKIVRAVWS